MSRATEGRPVPPDYLAQLAASAPGGMAPKPKHVYRALIAVLSDSSTKSARIAKLEKIATEQPLEPASTTQTIRLLPNYKGSSNTPAVVLGGVGRSQLADLKIDLSRSAYRSYKVTIDRVDQDNARGNCCCVLTCLGREVGRGEDDPLHRSRSL